MPRKAGSRNASGERRKTEKVIKKINKEFVETGAKRITDKDVEQVVKKADDIKRKFSTSGPLGKFLKDSQVLLSLVKDYWNKEYREIPYWAIAAIVFALLYVLSPVDLIPDPIPVVGYLDDAAVVAICMLLIEQELAQYEEWKSARLT